MLSGNDGSAELKLVPRITLDAKVIPGRHRRIRNFGRSAAGRNSEDFLGSGSSLG